MLYYCYKTFCYTLYGWRSILSQITFLSTECEVCEESRDTMWTTTILCACICFISPTARGYRADLSERSLSHGSRRGANMIQAKSKAFFRARIVLQNEPLANACINWLLMLYYEGSSLNGRGRPSKGRKYSRSRKSPTVPVFV